jgi:5-methylcytosine-specific restriction endonuclease McrA
MNCQYKPQILKLRSEGYTYNQIVEKVGCAHSTVSYYLSGTVRENARKRSNKNRKKRVADPLTVAIQQKLHNFNCDNRSGSTKKSYPTQIGIKELRPKLLASPICYLTGKRLDLLDKSTWSFDHIIPRSKGGTNSKENMGLVCSSANRCKHDLYLEDFLALCKTVLENFGYEVSEPEKSQTPSINKE